MSRVAIIVLALCCISGSVDGQQTKSDTDASAPHPQRVGHQELVPEKLSADLSVWPNKVSYRNSDNWLWQNHDKIRKMRPRVLVLNFANGVEMDHVRKHVEGIIKATAESTRYHGFDDPAAPAFIEYEVAKYVDLRDKTGPEAGKRVTSSLLPRKKAPKKHEVYCDYSGFYSDEFAKLLGFRDPRDPDRFLNLHELINAGIIHEMWFYAIHDGGDWPGCETCEYKQYYDENCRPIKGKHGPAGNGHDDTMPWSGRSFRIAFFNPHRGVGCSMENMGHTLEWMANSNSIKYYRKYFYEFAELDLDERYDVPFDELYRTDPSVKDSVTYLSPTAISVKVKDKTYKIDPYHSIGGNVHFPPGARHHYDLESSYTALSTIENYRLRNGPDGKDRALPFTKDKFARYADVAPDCMGRWLVFWRQCMPGLDNQCVDDDGRPMKNWWPFMFY